MIQPRQNDSECQLGQCEAVDAHDFLKRKYPNLEPFFTAIGVIQLPTIPEYAIDVAVTRIVIGQLLSGKAAATIARRVEAAVLDSAVPYSWRLDGEALRQCGLSARKVRTLREFGMRYETDKTSVEAWQHLAYEALRKEVGQIWGMSDWSASMLAIFYFGNSDVYPEADGSLARALEYLKSEFVKGRRRFDPHSCSPYRSYLALYLWRSLDCGFWRQQR